MDEIMKLLSPIITERLGEIFQQDKEYQQDLSEESKVYEKLSKELSGEQADELGKYFALSSATAGVRERLAYQQGMKDMFALIKYLLK